MSPAVLFLDVDGVVATEPTYDAAAAALGVTRRGLRALPLSPDLMLRLLSPEHVARVQRVCAATGAGYVLVTSWLDLFPPPDGDQYAADYPARCDAAREAHVAAIVAALRERGLTAPCWGAIPRARYKMSDYAGEAAHRRNAIVATLNGRPDVARWCVLDDDDEGKHYGYPHRGARHYHDPRFIGRCVHPVDGITDADAAAAVAILTGGAL